MNCFCHQMHTCHISVFVFLYFWVSLLERIRIRSPVQIYCLLFGWFQTGSEKKVDFSSFILSVLETLETFLVCLPSSSITRLCPQSNAVISCAWTCLSVPHDRQKKGILGAPSYGVSTHCLPESTTVEFSHFVGVHYTWKICLPPAFSMAHWCYTLWPGFHLNQAQTHSGSSGACKAHELTLLWVLHLQHPLKGLMSWLKYYPLEIPMQASVMF